MTDRKKCIEIAKTLAKIRDKWVCQRCGKTKPEVQIQGAHILPVTYGNTASDPENIIALCASDHEWARDSWHNSPLEQDWFEKKFPGRKERLLKKAYPIRPIKKHEWTAKLEELKNELRVVQKENQ